MAGGGPTEVDLLYLQMTRVLAGGSMAFGGDSHGREVAQRVGGPNRDHWENGYDTFSVLEPSYVEGGMTCSNYLGHMKYEQLLESTATIVIILCGGNDLDSLTVKAEHVINWHKELFNQLTARHKIVYICENPTRFSVRTPGLDYEVFKAQRQKLAREDLKVFGNRFIPLPSYCFNKENFEAKHHRKYGVEYVHLTDNCYERIATAVTDHIRDDLKCNKSPPSDPKLQLLTR